MDSNSTKYALPTGQQVEWAEYEVGVIIHYDIQVFEPSYKYNKKWGYHPDPKVFNPKDLDTDQWLRIAKEAGAKYAILTAKHCSGFCLWPSDGYDYCISKTPYKNGKGDIVREFIESCQKFGIKPGLYYSLGCNAYREFKKDLETAAKPGTKKYQEYCTLVEKQLREIWGNYGELAEIWFDGGHLKEGPDIAALLKELQPNAVCFQGPSSWKSNVRWVGNEAGQAPYPCWSTISNVDHYDGTKEIGDKHKGSPDGNIWMPAETDTPNRKFQWFWKKYQKFLIVPAEKLFDFYLKSVGRNSNLLLGMVVDNRGLIPVKDEIQFQKFGSHLKTYFGTPIEQIRGIGEEHTINFSKPTVINQIILQEEIQEGERILEFVIEGWVDNNWIRITSGSCIGHKRIDTFKKISVEKVKLTITHSRDDPKIRNFSVYNVPKIPKAKPFLLRLMGILTKI